MDTNQDVANAGVQAQGDMDKYLTKAHKAAKANTEVTERGVELGMVKPLRGKLLIAKARELEGAIAHAARLAAELHIEQTAVCVENGVDTGSVSTVGGITLPPTTQGGGGRG